MPRGLLLLSRTARTLSTNSNYVFNQHLTQRENQLISVPMKFIPTTIPDQNVIGCTEYSKFLLLRGDFPNTYLWHVYERVALLDEIPDIWEIPKDNLNKPYVMPKLKE